MGIANWVRHSHPALAALENPQFPDFGAAQGAKMREAALWLDQLLSQQPYIAGERLPSPTSRPFARWSLRGD